MMKTLRERLIGAWKLVSYVEKPVMDLHPSIPWERSQRASSCTRPTATCPRS